MTKRLRRNPKEGTIAGVLAGLGDYFDVDPVVLRVIFVFFVLATGIVPGVIAYILAIFIMPLGGAPKIHNVSSKEANE